ncbi:MAG: nitroreductase family protein [Dethiobacteria bacterium]|nr:nitroreductase family protein [Bacillota bacterium]
MEFNEVVKKRRSVRAFKKESVPKEIIIELLEAANMAPSATNSQPWSFLVLGKDDLEALFLITEEAFDERFGTMPRDEVDQKLSRLSIPDEDKFRGLSRFYKTLGGAPIVIVVSVTRGENDYNNLLNIASASAAVQNLLLAASSNGLGSCWMMGPLQKREKEIRTLLKIPAGQDIIAIVPVGYPEKEPLSPVKTAAMDKTRWGLGR